MTTLIALALVVLAFLGVPLFALFGGAGARNRNKHPFALERPRNLETARAELVQHPRHAPVQDAEAVTARHALSAKAHAR